MSLTHFPIFPLPLPIMPAPFLSVPHSISLPTHSTVERYSLTKQKVPVEKVELGVESQQPPKQSFLTAIIKITRLT